MFCLMSKFNLTDPKSTCRVVIRLLILIAAFKNENMLNPKSSTILVQISNLSSRMMSIFFRKHKLVKDLKRATVKQMIIYLSKLLQFIQVQNKLLCNFMAEKWKVPYQSTSLQFDYRMYWIQNHTFFHWF